MDEPSWRAIEQEPYLAIAHTGGDGLFSLCIAKNELPLFSRASENPRDGPVDREQ
jgi:hypothetical protein